MLVGLLASPAFAGSWSWRPRRTATTTTITTARLPTTTLAGGPLATAPTTAAPTTTAPAPTSAPTAAPTTTVPAPTTTLPIAGAPAGGAAAIAPLEAGLLLYDGEVAPGDFELFTARPDGTAVRRLTSDPATNAWWPRSSPDRTRIVFYRTAAGALPGTYAQASLWIMNADGTDARVLLPAGVNGWTFQAHAEWSPDGRRIVFTAGSNQAQITTIAPDGTDLRVLGGGPGANVDPVYTPDGRSIVYVGCPTWSCGTPDTEVFAMAADGSGTRTRLTTDTVRDNDPVVSPDGASIAVLSQTDAPSEGAPHGAWNLRTLRIDGSEIRQITSGTALSSAPRWSPDGRRIWTHRIAFDRYAWDLVSMNVDGSDLQLLCATYTQEFLAFT